MFDRARQIVERRQQRAQMVRDVDPTSVQRLPQGKPWEGKDRRRQGYGRSTPYERGVFTGMAGELDRHLKNDTDYLDGRKAGSQVNYRIQNQIGDHADNPDWRARWEEIRVKRSSPSDEQAAKELLHRQLQDESQKHRRRQLLQNLQSDLTAGVALECPL